MTRIAYTLVAVWFLALSFAPMTLLAKTNPTLAHQVYPACHGQPEALQSKARAKPHTAPAKAAKAPYSSARLAYVSKWTGDRAKAQKILKAVHKVAAETGLPPALIIAVMKPESKFNPRANSGKGDYGLMQVRAKHHRKRMARLHVKNIYDVEQNIRLGSDIIVDYKKSAKGNLRKALVRYTGGSAKAADRILREAKRVPA